MTDDPNRDPESDPCFAHKDFLTHDPTAGKGSSSSGRRRIPRLADAYGKPPSEVPTDESVEKVLLS
jgi:hypothetical protein